MSSEEQQSGEGIDLGLSDLLSCDDKQGKVCSDVSAEASDVQVSSKLEQHRDPKDIIIQLLKNESWKDALVALEENGSGAEFSSADQLVVRTRANLGLGEIPTQILFAELHEGLHGESSGPQLSDKLTEILSDCWNDLREKLASDGEISMVAAIDVVQPQKKQVSLDYKTTPPVAPAFKQRNASIRSLSFFVLFLMFGVFLFLGSGILKSNFELKSIPEILSGSHDLHLAQVKGKELEVGPLRMPTVPDVPPPSLMDGLAYDLDQLKDSSSVDSEPVLDNELRKGTIKQDGVIKANDTQPVAQVPSVKPTRTGLDMSGPKETEVIKAAFNRPREPVEDNKATILFGSPKPQITIGTTTSEQRRLGYPVEIFSERVVFRVLVKTDILSQPDIRARHVGALQEGDRVAGSSKIGDWIEIRSRNGDKGFVLSQDLVGESEWSAR